MSKIVVKKSGPLSGVIDIPGAKNSVTKLMAASIMADEPCVIENVPDLSDITAMKNLLKSLGLGVRHTKSKATIRITPAKKLSGEPPYNLVKEMRASVTVMGPLLAKLGKVKLPMPGGCQIGSRPIDLHIKGFQALGAKVYYAYAHEGRQVITEDVVTLAQIKSSDGYVIVEAGEGGLKGGNVYLDFPSVGATENIMLAASMAEGQTTIQNAAKEPEIIDLANYINEMGGNVRGAGTDTIRVEGVKKMGGTVHQSIPDRTIAITYMLAAVITKGEIELRGVMPSHLRSVTSKLREMGVEIIEVDDNVKVITPKERLKGTVLTTLPYPGIPTDVQAPFMALLSICDGTSVITESVFENRFMHVPEFNKMGANILTSGNIATVHGVDHLTGTEVCATDLRCGAALVLAGLVADGQTTVKDIYHIDRGYPSIEIALRKLGADITRLDDDGKPVHTKPPTKRTTKTNSTKTSTKTKKASSTNKTSTTKNTKTSNTNKTTKNKHQHNKK